MNKKLIIIFTFLFLNSCGFKPVFKEENLSKLNIKKINFSGQTELIYLLKNYLNFKTNNGQKGITINLIVNENISPASKNSSGGTTEELISISIKLDISDNENKNLLSENLISRKRLSINNNLSTYNNTKNIEKNNLILNLSQQIKLKLRTIYR